MNREIYTSGKPDRELGMPLGHMNKELSTMPSVQILSHQPIIDLRCQEASLVFFTYQELAQ